MIPVSSAQAGNAPWQFKLWQLFAATTFVACVAALIRWRGEDFVPAAVGMAIAWLNYGGFLKPFQAGRTRAAILVAAWLMFVASLFLPTAFGAPGWFAAWLAICVPVDYFDPNGADRMAATLWWVPLVDVANLLQFLLPLTLRRLSQGKGTRLAAAEMIAMIGVWVLSDSDLGIAYCVWCASFLLALSALPIGYRTLIAMHTVLVIEVPCRLFLSP